MNKVAYWKKVNGSYCIFTRCPFCKKEIAGGSWLAAHSMLKDLICTCECGKRYELGKIAPPPKEKS